MNEAEWHAFLTEYSRELLADERIRKRLPPEVVESGWLGYTPASEEEIVAVETRLGVRFPRSYRAFLRVTDGWRDVNTFVDRMWPTPGIAWFRQRNQEWIDAYVEPANDDPRLPDEKYLVYGKDQDSVWFRPEYLQNALEISDTGDDSILLLNPEIVTSDGEWEAWFFANWLPGARRYRSFAELMQQERLGFLELQAGKARQAAAPPRGPAPSRSPVAWTWAVALVESFGPEHRAASRPHPAWIGNKAEVTKVRVSAMVNYTPKYRTDETSGLVPSLVGHFALLGRCLRVADLRSSCPRPFASAFWSCLVGSLLASIVFVTLNLLEGGCICAICLIIGVLGIAALAKFHPFAAARYIYVAPASILTGFAGTRGLLYPKFFS